MAFNDYYEPKYLRGVIKLIHPVKSFFKNRFFNDAVKFPTPTVSFEFYDGGMKLAPYANGRSGPVPVSREGYTVRTYEPALLSMKRAITNDTIAQKLLGEAPYNSGISPEERAQEIAARDLDELTAMIYRKQEFMCARVLQDGKLTISGNGVHEVADFNFSNIENTQTSDKWTNTFDIAGKLKDKARELRSNGFNPDTLILGVDAASALLDNNKIQKLLDNRRIISGQINPRELEQGIEYLGGLILPGLFCDIYVDNEYYYDEDDQKSKSYMDGDCAILIDSKVKNHMLYGAITHIDQKTNQHVTEMNEYVPRTWVDIESSIQYLSVSSRCLPCPVDVRSWAVMKEVV